MKNIESISIGIIILLIAFKPSFLKTFYKDNLGKFVLFAIFIIATLISRTIGISMAVLLLSLNVGGISEGFLTEDEEEQEKIKQKELTELKAIKEARKAEEALPSPVAPENEAVVDLISSGESSLAVIPNYPATDSQGNPIPSPVTANGSVPSSTPAAVPASAPKLEGFTSNISEQDKKKIKELRENKCKNNQLIGKDGIPIIFNTRTSSYVGNELKDNYPNISFNGKQCNICDLNCDVRIDNWNPSNDDINKAKDFAKSKCKSQGTNPTRYLFDKANKQIQINGELTSATNPLAKHLLDQYPSLKFKNEKFVCNPCESNCDFVLVDSRERVTNEETMRPQPSNQTAIN